MRLPGLGLRACCAMSRAASLAGAARVFSPGSPSLATLRLRRRRQQGGAALAQVGVGAQDGLGCVLAPQPRPQRRVEGRGIEAVLLVEVLAGHRRRPPGGVPARRLVAGGADARRIFRLLPPAQTTQPDLIILDYHMPGNTGAHLYESLRRNNSTKVTPILFMSGEASPELILSEISDTERSQFLPKPVSLEDFRRTIRALLAGNEGG